MFRTTRALAIFVLALAALSACGSREPLQVTNIQLGRSLNPDGSVATHTTRFKPGDTIYVSVLTTGAGEATIAARWSYAGRVVSEPEKTVSYRDAAATEFHIQNSGGFPVGDYQVELFFNGESIGNRRFRIEK